MRLVYLSEARIEVLEAVTYYHSCQEGLAADFEKAQLEQVGGEGGFAVG